MDEINELDSRISIFSHNKFNVFSFYDKDHGERDGSNLKEWVLTNIRKFNIEGKVNNSIKVMKDDLIYYEKKRKIIQKAVSNIKIIKSNDEYSYLELNPITGRKHQLRKQLLNIKNPIIGDDKYFLNNIKRVKTKNLMLHAYKIKFMINNVQYNFKAKYNNEFKDFLKKFKSY